MLNTKAIDAIQKSHFSSSFFKPLYDSYCFSNIPQTIKNILLSENKKALPQDTLLAKQAYKKVILFLIDGFGWSFFEKYEKKYPFLQLFLNNGIVSPLTSQFPSTTPAQITTIHSGLPVGQHGIYEWFHYLPELDSIIAPLLFSFAGKRERDTLKSTNIDPKRIYPATTFYQELLKKDIASYTFVSAEYAHSPYSTVLFSGSEIMPYETFSELLATLTEHLFTNNKKSYYFVYFGNIDRMAHLYGSESAQCEAEIDTFLTAMQHLFVDKLQGKLDDTLLLLTADHGQITINPKQTIYLNKVFPQVEAWIKRNKNGQLLTPAGACRDMFLHIKSEFLDEAYAFLKEHLKGKAEVYFVKDLVKQGFFGKDISKTFFSHVGDIVILSLNHESVWWYEKDKFEVVYNGYHGGLTKDEIEIPFAVLPFGKL